MDSLDQAVWHAENGAAVAAQWQSPAGGLSEAEVAVRLQRHGLNHLPQAPGKPAWRRLLAQFHNPLIYLLFAAALMTGLLGDISDTVIILLAALANGLVGFIQEGRAETALAAVARLLPAQAVVWREGSRQSVPFEQLVPGDRVVLEAGERVAADLRLLEASELTIDESALTGESLAVSKTTEPVAREAPLAERRSMAYSGTTVATGQGIGVVVATGIHTELGRIGALIAAVEVVPTPLMQALDRLGGRLSLLVTLVALLALPIGVLAGLPWAEAILAAVAIAVAAIPEGLPAVMSITLAVGVRRMARRRAIVRSLPAVETLGGVSVICTDKTGTLTRNEMSVVELVTADGQWSVDGVGYAPVGHLATAARGPLSDIARVAVLCNDASLAQVEGEWCVLGDPTEGALLALASRLGQEAAPLRQTQPRLAVLPFSAERQWMASWHQVGDRVLLAVKGAPERVFERCIQTATAVGVQALHTDDWIRRQQGLAQQGERVLALAMAWVDAAPSQPAMTDVKDLSLLALTGIADPLRSESIDAVARCHGAGISVKMLTGDHALTAGAIAGKLGLRGASVLTGDDIDQLDDAALAKAAQQHSVFARTTAAHKLRLIGALRGEGATVAMTGDGVNDAPALKSADIGVAMAGRGSQAAREAAQIALADDHFATIANAVEEGRLVFDNLRKALLFLLPANFAQAVVVLAALLTGSTLPITAGQVLWVNLVVAVLLGLPLAFEPAEGDLMRRPPRDRQQGLVEARLIWRTLLVSLLLTLACFAMFEWQRHAGANLATARTATVNALTFGLIGYLFGSRKLGSASWRELLGGNVWLWRGVAACALLQVLFSYLPVFHQLLGTAGISLTAWAGVLMVGILVFASVTLEKRIWPAA
ncbi:cation-translocating P-type ATPase [Parachitinimonas caeni]|uniref:HAD-IC family P-type ATPase n=1 Tax=Parachitinimonas caeni TaxID=3031301 RepID=A0ABT7DXQ3_9NEIS|nr:HAD-IC family P-type ATPase [Parachitinimonas caeni]MDK2124848.1 HAD-IC family P-type ATPase [Parachitinimonas caeni]